MKTIDFNVDDSVAYAKKWALKRNPKYYDFDGIGGDCTNFISQCIFSGAKVMNFTPVTGWYYNSVNSRAPSWTGVNELYSFLIKNKGVGPYGTIVPFSNVKTGDLIQLQNKDGKFFHTLIVSEVTPFEILVCSHSRDALNLPLGYFSFYSLRCIRIVGVNVN